MSVGHIARVLEEKGIATVVIAVQAFEKKLKAMMLPRLLITPYAMGRTLGPPHSIENRNRIIKAALGLLDTAEKVGTVSHF